MLVLGIDSATSTGSVGLVLDGKPVGEYSYTAQMSQSERLLPAIDLLLSEQGVERDEVDLLAVSRGPGSFTGLRIGISVAKGLAHALGIPVRGVSLSDTYYDRVRFYSGPIWVVIKDRRELVYYAAYEEGKKIQEESSRPVSVVTNQLEERYQDSARTVLLVGDGLWEHEEEFSDVEGAKMAEGRLNYPSGAQTASLALRETGGNQLMSLEPLYAQRPVAEREWEDD